MQNILLLKKIKKSADLAIKLSEVKSYLKIANEYDDKLLILFIESAIHKFENMTGISLLNSKWSCIVKTTDYKIFIPIQTLQSIENFEAIDDYNNETYSINDYKINHYENSVVIKNQTYSEYNITFISGFGEHPDTIPSNIQVFLLKHVAYMYENRDANTDTDLSLYSEFYTDYRLEL